MEEDSEEDVELVEPELGGFAGVPGSDESSSPPPQAVTPSVTAHAISNTMNLFTKKLP